MTVYLSLGANLGNREQTIQTAIDRLATAGTVVRQSSWFYSEPWGFQSEHAFCNCCVQLETELSPLALLDLTQSIERELGRRKKTEISNLKSQIRNYSDRSIDIDLISAYDAKGQEIIISSDRLTLPHPLWRERDFVRIPLEEIQKK